MIQQTSRAAYESVQKDGTAADHRRKILAALELYGPANAYQVAERLGMRKEQCGRRMGQLRDEGKIEDTGDTAPTDSGRAGIVYRIKQQIEQ